jgi:hypothetical protein
MFIVQKTLRGRPLSGMQIFENLIDCTNNLICMKIKGQIHCEIMIEPHLEDSVNLGT